MGEVKPSNAPGLTMLARGEMADRVRAFDWSSTPLGAIETWSPSLRCAVDMVLATQLPMALRWARAGADLQ